MKVASDQNSACLFVYHANTSKVFACYLMWSAYLFDYFNVWYEWHSTCWSLKGAVFLFLGCFFYQIQTYELVKSLFDNCHTASNLQPLLDAPFVYRGWKWKYREVENEPSIQGELKLAVSNGLLPYGCSYVPLYLVRSNF